MRALVLFLALIFAQAVQSRDRSGDYAAAEDAYRQGHFSEAVRIYLEAIHEGEGSASLFYNLGTNLYKNGETGAALAAYLRARSLDPADPDVRYNVRFLQEKVRDKLDTQMASDRWRNMLATRWFHERTLFWWTVIPLALAICLAGWQLGSGRAPWLSWTLSLVLLVGAVYPGFSLAHRLWREPDWGAIMAPQVDVLASPTVRNTVVIFQLHEGAPCAVTNESGDWFKIRLSDGKSGWIRKDAIAIFGKKFFSYQMSKNRESTEKSAL